ncbi:hypothetical protein L0Y65_06490 [Candidatus Micrarchaeota archaeon]|nr:hypothetical protein [Candidatus Micrarchaeota archaeon]
MNTPPFHLTLGLSSAARKRNLRSRMEAQAAENASKGLSTRIPFLKRVLCTEKTQKGESARCEPIMISGDAPAGHVFSIRDARSGSGMDARATLLEKMAYLAALKANMLLIPAWMQYEYRIFNPAKDFYEDIIRFNSQNAGRGLQAFPLESGQGGSCRVEPCKLRYLGDLRIARISGNERGLMLAAGGVFQPLMFGVFLSRKQKCYSPAHVMVHEIEHAQHHSLWHLARFPARALSHETAEYLAMLRTIWFLGESQLLLSGSNLPPGMKLAEGIEQTPHHASAMHFKRRLRYAYLFSDGEIARAGAFCIRNCMPPGHGEELGNQHLESFLRLQAAARKEYDHVYRKLFGIHMDDLCDVVSQLNP